LTSEIIDNLFISILICLDGSAKLESHESYGQCQTGIGLDTYPSKVLFLKYIVFLFN